MLQTLAGLDAGVKSLSFNPDGQVLASSDSVSKIYMTRVEGENIRLRYYLARLHHKTLCYSESVDMLKYSIRLLLHYLKYREIPVFN
ncbi:MAG: IS1 family transposase [Nostoc sp.]